MISRPCRVAGRGALGRVRICRLGYRTEVPSLSLGVRLTLATQSSFWRLKVGSMWARSAIEGPEPVKSAPGEKAVAALGSGLSSSLKRIAGQKHGPRRAVAQSSGECRINKNLCASYVRVMTRAPSVLQSGQ